jgi:hypothetical protein
MKRFSRRQLLGIVAGSGLTLGSAKAIDNVVLGYGGIGGGTNLREQDLDPLLTENRAFGGRIEDGDQTYHIDDDRLWVGHDDDWQQHFFDEQPEDLAGDALDLFQDARELRTKTDYEYHTREEFFARLDETSLRPLATAALRGGVTEPTSPEIVTQFSGVSPTDGEGLITGLKDGFREYGYYDVPRYIAGSVQDNVIQGARDLRAPFEGPTDFETLVENERTGLFCYELTYRAIEALHSVPAIEQNPPLASFWVRDRRHKHVYNGIASVLRDDGDLRVPVTFLDYTDSTLYNDLRMRWITGEGLCAYDTGHRADEIHWNV